MQVYNDCSVIMLKMYMPSTEGSLTKAKSLFDYLI